MFTTKAIELLEKGEDFELREQACEQIDKITAKSYKGEIGWGDFVDEIRKIINETERLGEKYWDYD